VCTCTLPIVGDGYHVLGCHKTITPCILPPSIPKQSFDAVKAHFENLFKEEINTLDPIQVGNVEKVAALGRSEARLHRMDSIESQALSLSAGEAGQASNNFVRGMWKAISYT